MTRIALSAIAGAILLAGTAFVVKAQTNQPAANQATVNQATVNIDNFTFSPATLTVAAGTMVTWTNRDDIPHTVVDASEPRLVKSPPLDTGEHFAHTFTATGTFHYFCSLHPHMQGTIVVR